ncbi:MAG TPA: type II toxin-antitoxin system Phd/YefM family antitoxin [Tichowtungia sp.]|nr:type II toxin-antitoxin system Phd/YefM family antitoxin [Tichowtungia sp.]
MKTILISDFKAHCIAELDAARKTGETLTITRRGTPIARVLPIADQPRKRTLGNMGMMKIKGDIVQADFHHEWEMES